MMQLSLYNCYYFQSQQVSLEKEQQATSEVGELLEEFGELYPTIPLRKFIEELADIEEANSRLQTR